MTNPNNTAPLIAITAFLPLTAFQNRAARVSRNPTAVTLIAYCFLRYVPENGVLRVWVAKFHLINVMSYRGGGGLIFPLLHWAAWVDCFAAPRGLRMPP